MAARLQWDRDGADWPHRRFSRFVEAGGLRWHVQQVPETPSLRPRCLLLHGTGASTHSWRAMIPLLVRHFDLLAMDLPGHAFTSLPAGGIGSSQLSLPGMAQALAQLLDLEGFAPDLVVGHSAGAAIGAQMALDRAITPRLLVSINGALLPLGGLAGRVFSPAARLMALLPGVPSLFAWRAADPQVLQRLLDSTGSRLDAKGQDFYARLAANPGHVEGALGMMANWDLPAFAQALPGLPVPLSLMVGALDATVPPGEADRVQALLAGRVRVEKVVFEGLGHLAHEERPEPVADEILAAWARHTPPAQG